MIIKFRNAIGTTLLIGGLPVFAQGTASSSPSATIDCKPCASNDAQITPPGGPTWLIVVIALVVGLAIGYVAGKLLGGKEGR